ncbi:UNVERIFIED_CONTAM: hypothetical protein FKN15_039992 [Acipenser sinensis]
MSGTGVDISLVHWKQQWLENGTLYFHVSMSSAEHLSQVTPPPLREPSEIVDEQMHVLHISVMGSPQSSEEKQSKPDPSSPTLGVPKPMQLPPESPAKTVCLAQPGLELAIPGCMTHPAGHTAVLLPGENDTEVHSD